MSEIMSEKECDWIGHDVISQTDFYNGNEHLLQTWCSRCGIVIEKIEDKNNEKSYNR